MGITVSTECVFLYFGFGVRGSTGRIPPPCECPWSDVIMLKGNTWDENFQCENCVSNKWQTSLWNSLSASRLCATSQLFKVDTPQCFTSVESVQYITHSQYTTYIKQDSIITIRWYLSTCFGCDRPSSGQLRTTTKVLYLNCCSYFAWRWPVTAETCSQISPNCNYGILFGVLRYTTLIVLSWPEDGRSRPKHVAKYHLIVIIASCLMYVVYWLCIIYYTDLIIHNGMASLKFTSVGSAHYSTKFSFTAN